MGLTEAIKNVQAVRYRTSVRRQLRRPDRLSWSLDEKRVLYHHLRVERNKHSPEAVSRKFGIPLPVRLEKSLDDWERIPQIGEGVAYAVDALLGTAMSRRGVDMPDILAAVEDIVSRMHPIPFRAVCAELTKTDAWAVRVNDGTEPCTKTVSNYCHRLGYRDRCTVRSAVTDVAAATGWMERDAPVMVDSWGTILNADESIHNFSETEGALLTPAGVVPKVAASGGQVGLIFTSFLSGKKVRTGVATNALNHRDVKWDDYPELLKFRGSRGPWIAGADLIEYILEVCLPAAEEESKDKRALLLLDGCPMHGAALGRLVVAVAPSTTARGHAPSRLV